MSQLEKVLQKRIFAEGETKWEQVCDRVSKYLADTPEEYDEFYEVLLEKKFLPNSPCLKNAGISNQLFACFVLPIEDSMDSIFSTLRDAMLIQKTGGGTGFSFSRLRGKGEKVGKHGGESSGVLPFLKAYDSATESVKQGGVRRGANMGVLNINHPDIYDFITCKTDNNVTNNFNLSVGMTDEFMQNPDEKLINKIVDQMWLNGEPGILFMDEINRKHLEITGIKEEIEATNPCGEQPLLPYECCCLGSLNLANIDTTPMLREVARIGIKMLNKVLDKNNYPLPQNREIAMKNRKIGLGVMGYADLLIMMKHRYGTKSAYSYTEACAQEIQRVAQSEGKKYGNKTVTTIAPTGTLSIIAGVSSGIEPNFAWKQTIERTDEVFSEVAPITEGYDINNLPEYFVTAQEIDVEGHIRTQAIWQKYTDNAVSKTINLPNSATKEDVRKAIFLAWELKCKGITVYRDGSRESQVIKDASKPTKDRENHQYDAMRYALMANIKTAEPDRIPTERPQILSGRTGKYQTGCGNLYVTVNDDESGNQIEVFTSTQKGGCPAQSEALTRIVAKALQHGMPKEAVIRQLKGIRCPSCTNRNLGVSSCPDAIAKTLQNAKSEAQKLEDYRDDVHAKAKAIMESNKKECPECGAKSNNAGGCFTCPECGFGKCG